MSGTGEGNASGYGTYCYNLSTRRKFMVLGTLLSTIFFFFKNLYVTVEEAHSLTKQQPFPIIKRGGAIKQQPFPIIKRGGAFITTHSGCRIAKWI